MLKHKARILCVLPGGKELQDEGLIEERPGSNYVHIRSDCSGALTSYPKCCTVIYWEEDNTSIKKELEEEVGKLIQFQKGGAKWNSCD